MFLIYCPCLRLVKSKSIWNSKQQNRADYIKSNWFEKYSEWLETKDTHKFKPHPTPLDWGSATPKRYLILLREVCWNRCRRHRFQLSLAHYFPGGAPLPQSVETCTAIVLTVDTFWGSPTLNLEGWGGFKLVGVLSLKSLWILFKPVWLDVVCSILLFWISNWLGFY